MPKFCRHNRLIQNCPICSREQAIEPRPLVSSSMPRTAEPRTRSPQPTSRRERPGGVGARSGVSGVGARSGVRVRHLRTTTDDGYRSPLVPGLKSSQEAERLAEEVAFAATRLARLSSEPPGLYAEVAGGSEPVEDRTWLAFLIAYLYPLDGPDPFAAVRDAWTSWREADQLRLLDPQTGQRSGYDPERWPATITAYRTWAARSGSQAEAFSGDRAWNPERRFARVFERLALPGISRDVRFELLTSLGALGLYELRAGALALGGGEEVTVAAKRALGIGDVMVLERRAAQLAGACAVPLAALDLAFYNWERGVRVTAGMGAETEPDQPILERALEALGR